MPTHISRLLARTGLGCMSTDEYRDNCNRLNRFFGAVLGSALMLHT